MHPQYWFRQTEEKPLFPDIEWNKPEQKSRAGKLTIIGGTHAGFIATAESYHTALQIGVGHVRVIMPDTLQKLIPPDMTDVVFAESNKSGGFSKEALTELRASCAWADTTLLIGDAGRNSETAIVYESILKESTQPFVITRDAVDLLKHSAELLLTREKTTLVVSFAQLRNLLQTVYYPKILTLSMPLKMFIDALHKVTITYPVMVVTFFNDQLIVAYNGDVSTTPWTNPMALWRGEIATRASAFLIWTPHQPFEAVSTSII
jgi:hypothetical protein